jgi:predicted esterase
MLDDVAEPFGGQPLLEDRGMPRLSTGRTAGGFFDHGLGRAGRIGRGGERGIAGVLTQACLKVADDRFQFGDPPTQLLASGAGATSHVQSIGNQHPISCAWSTTGERLPRVYYQVHIYLNLSGTLNDSPGAGLARGSRPQYRQMTSADLWPLREAAVRMKSWIWFVGLIPIFAWSTAAAPPEKSALPDPSVLKSIDERGTRLANAVAELRRLGVADALLTDIEVYHKAALWAIRQGELRRPEDVERTLAVLDRGLLRASQQGRGESPWLNLAGFAVARGYRSRLDGSVQPYAVTFPPDYGKDQRRRWRLDVVLHGRDDSLNEVKFLHQHRGDAPAPAGQSFVQLDIFGRGNNAYRWAGEVDVSEAVDSFLTVERGLSRAQLLDPSRVVLRGFSMGGAGTWHIGLQRPDHWCAIAPGAGFTTTRGYVPGIEKSLTPEQAACLSIYDAIDYAENAANVPVVAYAGEKDPQLRAAQSIQDKLKPLGIPMTLLVAPGPGHKFPPEWQAKVEEELVKHVAAGRPEYPKRLRFVTYTTRCSGCDWVQILALDRHYSRALVDASRNDDGFKFETTNVRILDLRLPSGATRQTLNVDGDGQRFESRPCQLANGELHLYLEKREGKWSAVYPERITVGRARSPQKLPGLQGPIDDAFTGSFLCVRGTNKPWHGTTQEYAEENLRHFQEEWSRYFRGELPVKDDVDITAEDIASRHLILFGDPASNALIEQVLPGLPLTWTKERISLDGREVDSANHIPVVIYPSPLALEHYVVLNSGHTFHAADFRGTNALLYPRLGDFALLKLKNEKNDPLAIEVLKAGLFDDFWHYQKP